MVAGALAAGLLLREIEADRFGGDPVGQHRQSRTADDQSRRRQPRLLDDRQHPPGLSSAHSLGAEVSDARPLPRNLAPHRRFRSAGAVHAAQGCLGERRQRPIDRPCTRRIPLRPQDRVVRKRGRSRLWRQSSLKSRPIGLHSGPVQARNAILAILRLDENGIVEMRNVDVLVGARGHCARPIAATKRTSRSPNSRGDTPNRRIRPDEGRLSLLRQQGWKR